MARLIRHPLNSGKWATPYRIGRGPSYEAFTDSILFPSPPSGTGLIKYWSGAAWLEKPMKVWTGAAWATKPVKFWNGSNWVLA